MELRLALLMSGKMLQCCGMQYELLLMIVKSPDNLYLQVPMPLTNPKYTILELVVLPDCVCCL